MTAYVTLQELPLERLVRAAPYHSIYGESLLGLRAGQRISVRDLLYGLILRSGNDAAHDLALAAAGSLPRFVVQMNRRRRRPRPRRYPLREPGRARPARQLLQRSRPGDAESATAAHPRLRQDRRRPQCRAAQLAAAAPDRDHQRASADGALGDRGQDRPHLRRRLRPRWLRPPQGGRPDLGRDRRPERRSPLPRQPRTARIRILASTAAACRSTLGRISPILRFATPVANCRCGRRGASRSACARTSGSGSWCAPRTRSRGRSVAARRSVARLSSSTGARPRRLPLRAGRSIPAASAFDRVRAFLGNRAIPIVLAGFVILIGGVLLYRRGRRGNDRRRSGSG